MAESILNGKRILAVDDEPDVLAVLEEEILAAAPKCKFEKATTYQEAIKKLESQNYDVVVLDIMGVRGFDLLDRAVKRTLSGGHADSPFSQSRVSEAFHRNEGPGLPP